MYTWQTYFISKDLLSGDVKFSAETSVTHMTYRYVENRLFAIRIYYLSAGDVFIHPCDIHSCAPTYITRGLVERCRDCSGRKSPVENKPVGINGTKKIKRKQRSEKPIKSSGRFDVIMWYLFDFYVHGRSTINTQNDRRRSCSAHKFYTPGYKISRT